MPKAGRSISPLDKAWRKNVPPVHIIDQERQRQRQQEDDQRPGLHAPRPEEYAGYENWVREQEQKKPEETEGSWTFDISSSPRPRLS